MLYRDGLQQAIELADAMATNAAKTGNRELLSACFELERSARRVLGVLHRRRADRDVDWTPSMSIFGPYTPCCGEVL